MSVCVLCGIEVQGVREFTLNITDRAVLAENEVGFIFEDAASRASDVATPNLRGSLPNNLGEVEGLGVLGVTGVITFSFINPKFGPVEDGETAGPGGNVLCKFDREYPQQPGTVPRTTYLPNLLNAYILSPRL